MKAGALSMMMPPFGAERRKPGRPPVTDALTPSGRKKRKKRIKDPNAPKRCMYVSGSYFPRYILTKMLFATF